MAKDKSTNPEMENAEEALAQKAEETFQAAINKAREAAFTLKKVIIVLNDPNQSGSVSTSYISCDNQYFSLAKLVPLNIPIDLEQCLIATARDARIPLHQQKQDGTCYTVIVPKYNITEA